MKSCFPFDLGVPFLRQLDEFSTFSVNFRDEYENNVQSRDLILPQFLVSGTTPPLLLECSTREAGVEGNYLVSYPIGPFYVKNQKDVGFFHLRRGFEATYYNITYNHSDLGATVGFLLGSEKFNLSWSHGPANVKNTRVLGSFLTLTTHAGKLQNNFIRF